MQSLDDLVDRLFAEIRDRDQLGLRLGDQIALRLDSRPLQAVVGAHTKLELLDQDAPLLALQRRLSAARAATDRESVAVELPARHRAQLLDPIGVGKDREL